jgi:hypothetical protein
MALVLLSIFFLFINFNISAIFLIVGTIGVTKLAMTMGVMA